MFMLKNMHKYQSHKISKILLRKCIIYLQVINYYSYESALRYNAAQVELWKRFVDFAFNNYYLKNQEEEKTKQIFERALDNVGNHMKAADIWIKYIDFELMLNHMGFMNLLFYQALKTPLLDVEGIEQK